MNHHFLKTGWKVGLIAMITAFAMLLPPSSLIVSAEKAVSSSDMTIISGEKQEEVKSDADRSGIVRKKAPDVILSGQGRKGASGPKYRKFLPQATYDGSYKSELDENEKKIYQGLYDTFVTNRKPHTETVVVRFSPKIEFPVVYSDVENDAPDDRDLEDVTDMILSAAAAFFYDCPQAFWIRSFAYSLYYTFSEGGDTGTVGRIDIEFDTDAYPNAYDDIAAFDAGIAEAVNIITQARSNQSVYATLKAIHDYILLNASYDYGALSGSVYTYGYAYTAAPLFTGKGTFVCEGYAKAFKILCDRFGIGCALVSGNGMTSASSGGPHMWNYVRMPDGKWYGVDATWDDGYFLQDGTPFPYYTYFLIGSSTEVRNNRTFAQDHIPDGQIMTQPMKFSMVYPELSEVAYDHYIVDTDPKITLTTLGASIRISDPYGIRFGIQLKRDEALSSIHYIPEFGTLIIASGTLGNNELTINTPKVRKIKANNIFSQDETQYTYTGVLINIPESFFGTNVKGRGYLIYVDDETGEEHIVYSETVERSFYGVAQAAYDSYSGIADPDEDQQAIIEKLRGFLENR
jgi:Transglutaminase-like superfamily.